MQSLIRFWILFGQFGKSGRHEFTRFRARTANLLAETNIIIQIVLSHLQGKMEKLDVKPNAD